MLFQKAFTIIPSHLVQFLLLVDRYVPCSVGRRAQTSEVFQRPTQVGKMARREDSLVRRNNNARCALSGRWLVRRSGVRGVPAFQVVHPSKVSDMVRIRVVENLIPLV